MSPRQAAALATTAEAAAPASQPGQINGWDQAAAGPAVTGPGPSPGPGLGPGLGPDGPAWPGPLTDRECEVAKLIAEGLSNRAIGHKLFISQSTAARHVANIFAKLGFNTRAQVTAWVVKAGTSPSELTAPQARRLT